MDRRAIGIVRVSQTAGREGDSFASPGEQRDRLTSRCTQENLDLTEIIEELDVSGGTPLDERAGLRAAVEAIEDKRAEVLVVAYFDRLVRSLRIQDEVVSRVEAAGGQVLALDIGTVTNATAGQWLSGTMLGAVNEYQRRTSAERSREAQIRAISRGVCPWPNDPPGYRRDDNGRLHPHADEAKIVAEAFELRRDGATIADVRAYLASHGITRSYRGAQSLLGSRVVLGEIHFGDYPPNLTAHEAIVHRDLWAAVQRVMVSRGRRATSDRLLARLGVLRCGTCDSRMVVGTHIASGRNYPFYRCASHRPDCSQRFTISAEIAEHVVSDAVRARLADAEGRASVEQNAADAEIDLERTQGDLDAALRAFAGMQGEQAAVERLAELRHARDAARERAEALRGTRPPKTIGAAGDWDRLSFNERRALIRATLSRVVVGPGQGAGRLGIEFLGE